MRIIDPLTAEGRSVPVQALPVRDAVPLDDGRILLRGGSLLDPETGALERVRPPSMDLSAGYARSLSGGRAVFWTGGSDTSRCYVLTFFLGASRGFVDVPAGQRGMCIAEVIDLGEGEILVARTLGQPGRDHELEVLLLKLDGWRWQVGARVSRGHPFAAFRQGQGILVLLDKGSGGGDSVALLLDRAGGAPKMTTFSQLNLKLYLTRRHDAGGFLLFDARGVLRWDPENRRVAAARLPGPDMVEPLVVERDDRIVMIDSQGYNATYVLSSEDPAPSRTPCDDAFRYAEAVLRSGYAGSLDPERLLLAAGKSPGCLEWLDTQDRFPDSIQVPLDALVSGQGGPSKPEQDAAARVLCTLNPAFAAPQVSRLARGTGLVDGRTHQLCTDAEEQGPVVEAAGQGTGASAALVRAALRSADSQLRPWTVPFLLSREPVRRAAGPLLLATQAQRSAGFDALRATLCQPAPDPALAPSCAATRADQEKAWAEEEVHKRRTGEHHAILGNLGIATAIIGGLGGLAYLDREGDAGRAIAIGSGAIAGVALGAALGISTPSSGDRGAGRALAGLVLGIVGGIAGGLIAGNVSSEPGTTRFATAAVPLSIVWLMSAGIAAHAW